MNLGHFASMDSAYRRLIDEVHSRGFACEPRGRRCVELRPASFSLADPFESLYTGTSRKLSHRILAMETACYIGGLGGVRHAQLMTACSRHMAQFVNPDTGEMDGAYGPRLALGLHEVVGELAEDPWSRRAVAPIWGTDVKRDSLDVPCTVSLQFLVDSYERLCLVATMRSNDLNWGTPYDVPAFCAIQAAVAYALGRTVGWYSHQTGSLHVYDDAPPNVPSPDKEAWEPSSWPTIPMASDDAEPRNLGHAISTWHELALSARFAAETCYSQVVLEKKPWKEVSYPADASAFSTGLIDIAKAGRA